MADIQVARLLVPLIAETQNFVKGLGGATKQATSWAANIAKTVAKAGLAVMATAAAGAAAAVAGVGVALAKLAIAAAPLEGIGIAFDKMASRVGLSLDELRHAAAGTISDFELMRKTNVALTGAGDDLADAFGRNLPQLLKVARAAAKATGQSVDFLFESLVSGVKRSSPMLIDNTGLVLKLGEANQAMADSLGIAVGDLSAEQKQIALLNATVLAGERMISEFGGGQVTAAEQIAQFRAQIQNTKDQIGLAFLPALQALLTPMQDIAAKAGPKLIEWAQVAGKWLGENLPTAIGILKDLLRGDFSDAIAGIATIISRTFGRDAAMRFYDFRDAVVETIGRVEGVLKSFAEEGIFVGLENLFDLLGIEPPPELWDGLNKVLMAVQTVKDWFVTNWPIIQAVALTAWEVIRDIAMTVADMFTSTILPQFQEAFAGLTEILAVFGYDWSDVWEAAKVAIGIVAAAIGAIIVGIIGVIVGIVSAISGVAVHIVGAFQDIAETFRSGLEAISKLVAGAMAIVRGIFTGDLELIKAGFASWGRGVTEMFTVIWQGIVNLFNLSFGTLIALVSGFVEGVIGFFQGLYDRLIGKSIVKDMFNEMLDFFSDIFDKIAATVRKGIDLIVSIFERISSAVKEVIRWVEYLAEVLLGIKLPDWLTGDSPTPFETGLRGISDAMHDLSMIELPSLDRAMKLAVAPAGGVMGGGGTTTNYGGDTVYINDRLASALYLERRRLDRIERIERS